MWLYHKRSCIFNTIFFHISFNLYINVSRLVVLCDVINCVKLYIPERDFCYYNEFDVPGTGGGQGKDQPSEFQTFISNRLGVELFQRIKRKMS